MTSQPYKSTPVFDETSLPQALRRAHNTKPGAWALIQVLEGMVRYHVEDGSIPPVDLVPGKPGLIRPGQLHHVEPLGPMRMRVDFYDHEPAIPSGLPSSGAARTGMPDIVPARPVGAGRSGDFVA
ncbi:MAG TPA: DUF1971 domain-containing protein [Sphingobium sp.]|nr:DUF1971 domain-containing protein [Sphingobium sp.]